MSNIDIIIDAVAEHHGIKRSTLILKFSSECFFARQMLCYYIYQNHPKLKEELAKKLKMEPENCHSLSSMFKKRMITDKSLYPQIVALKSDINRREYIDVIEDEHKQESKKIHVHNKNAKQLFNIEYTFEEELRRLEAIKSSITFMNKHCKTGRQPIEEGMVFPK